MSADCRTSFRFLVQPEMNSAKLRWRTNSLTVELIDQSATGFSFKAPKDTDIKLNEIVSLTSWAGDCQAIVVRLAQQREFLRVGLERTSDLIAQPSSTRWLSRLLNVQPIAPSQFVGAALRKHWIAAAIVLGGVTVATCVASFDSEIGPAPTTTDLTAESAQSTKEPSETTPDATPASSIAATGLNSSPLTVNTIPSSTLEQLLTLKNAKTADALGLSERQKLEISQLLGDLSGTVAKVKPQPTRKGQAKRAAKINSLIVAAEARLNQILSEEQQARWLGER